MLGWLLLLQVPEDIQPVEVPVLFICAESDAQFPEKMRTAALQVLEDKAPGETRGPAGWWLSHLALQLPAGWVTRLTFTACVLSIQCSVHE